MKNLFYFRFALLVVLLMGCKKEDPAPPVPDQPDFAVKAAGSYRGTLNSGSKTETNVVCTVVRADKNSLSISINRSVETIVFSRQPTTGEGTCRIDAMYDGLRYVGTASYDGENIIIDTKAGSTSAYAGLPVVYTGKK